MAERNLATQAGRFCARRYGSAIAELTCSPRRNDCAVCSAQSLRSTRRRGALSSVVAAVSLVVAVPGACVGCAQADAASRPTGGDAGTVDSTAPPDLEALATEAFIWGYPSVLSQRRLQAFGGLVGVNVLFNQTAVSDASARITPAPNQDTLYSIAVVDLSSEPMVLTVPDVLDRYWTYQFLDGWTESFHYIGTRATRGKGGRFVVTPPGWEGALPAGAERIASPTPQLFILGRYLVRGDDDVPNVTILARTLEPLSVHLGESAAPPSPPLTGTPGARPPVGEDGAAFFDELGDSLAANPPASDFDREQLERFAPLGIGPDEHPAADGDADRRALFDRAAAAGLATMKEANGSEPPVNGWTVRTDAGRYGSDALLRAQIARFGWGANVAEEAVYPVSTVDGANEAYDGTRQYQMHFEVGDLPPVDPALGFWSLTVYTGDLFFYDNPLAKHSIRPHADPLAFNDDGSLHLFVGGAGPPPAMDTNWLPAPDGPFVLMLRLYLPQTSVLEGAYAYPAVLPVE